MTWVIGASSLFGYGVLLSDIQVTVGNKRFDLLQKGYPLSKFIAGGFAGSVKIGFELLQSLSDMLQMPPNSDHLAWDPLKIAPHWSPIAKNIFAQATPQEKVLGSRFLIVAASPYPLGGTWPPGWDSKIFLIRFSSPDFKPQIMSKRVKFCSIGSGARVDKFKRIIRTKGKLGIFDSTLKTEVRNPFGWAKTLASSLFSLVDENPQDGISKHFNIITVKRGEINQSHINYKIHLPDGTTKEEKMPELARSYHELEAMLAERKINISGAIC